KKSSAEIFCLLASEAISLFGLDTFNVPDAFLSMLQSEATGYMAWPVAVDLDDLESIGIGPIACAGDRRGDRLELPLGTAGSKVLGAGDACLPVCVVANQDGVALIIRKPPRNERAIRLPTLADLVL